MNIFIPFKDFKQSVQFLHDKHVTKMPLESAQMLSTALHVHFPDKITMKMEYSPKYKKVIKNYYLDSKRIYSSTHVNHPCTKFTYFSRANFKKHLKYWIELNNEFFNRRGKYHSSFELLDIFNDYADKLPENQETDFPNCAAAKESGLDFKHIDDVNLAYRLYLEAKYKLWSKI